MSKEKEKVDFLQVHKDGLEHIGFWNEFFKETVLKSIEQLHKAEIIKEFSAVDIILNDKKVLIKWVKRFQPLSDEELKDDYGR